MSSVLIITVSSNSVGGAKHFPTRSNTSILLSTFFLGDITHGASVTCSSVDWVPRGWLHGRGNGPSLLFHLSLLRNPLFPGSHTLSFILLFAPMHQVRPWAMNPWTSCVSENVVIPPSHLIYSLVENVIPVRSHFPQDCEAFLYYHCCYWEIWCHYNSRSYVTCFFFSPLWKFFRILFSVLMFCISLMTGLGVGLLRHSAGHEGGPINLETYSLQWRKMICSRAYWMENVKNSRFHLQSFRT